MRGNVAVSADVGMGVARVGLQHDTNEKEESGPLQILYSINMNL
jgi:hypothetical protein